MSVGAFIGFIFLAAFFGLLIQVFVLESKIKSYCRAHAQYRRLLADLNVHLLTPQKWHDLKCHPPYFDQVYRGLKTFDVRANDRSFMAGDGIRLREFVPTRNEYTGRTVCVYVLGVYTSLIGVRDGHCVMSIRIIAPPL
jgi:hypothetical protein